MLFVSVKHVLRWIVAFLAVSITIVRTLKYCTCIVATASPTASLAHLSPEQKHAVSLVLDGKSVFVTGKAGTGTYSLFVFCLCLVVFVSVGFALVVVAVLCLLTRTSLCCPLECF